MLETKTMTKKGHEIPGRYVSDNTCPEQTKPIVVQCRIRTIPKEIR